jgi:translation initiation factor 1
MKKNLFEMGANFEESWSADNKNKAKSTKNTETKPPLKHQLHFSKEKRRGKTVTIVKPFYLEKNDLQQLLKTLKKKLGTGGTIKEEMLEFQGEVKESLEKHLKDLGYHFKK